jgi:acyl-CoA reductase-like NAD-dependent aldehyde dehydrogenase
MEKIVASHWINGEWLSSSCAGTFASVNPANGETLGQVMHGSAIEARAAIAAARDTFDAGEWAASPRVRAAVLLDFAQRLEADAKPLAALLTAENGKLLRESAGEVDGAVSELRYYAGLARTLAGRAIEIAPGVTSLLAREAAGVAAIIVPWNAPLILLVRSLAPALAAGCTVVVKAAPQTALFMWRVMQHLAAVPQLPRGAVNLVFEQGSEAAEELVRSSDVDVLSYTGSTAVGKKIMMAAAPTLKRLSLELGGKAPCVICDDADLSKAVPEILAAGTILAGQQCTAATRILVQRGCYEQFRERMVAQIRALKVGPGDRPDSQMGALIDVTNRDRILQLLDSVGDRHSFAVRGGLVSGLPASGAFVSPSLVEVDDPSSPMVQNEHFGPVLTLEPFDGDRDGVALANATKFGLGASVWTRDLARAHRIARGIRSGTVWINAHNKLFAEAETGGYRESGFGRLHGVEGMNDFLETKHIYQDVGTL